MVAEFEIQLRDVLLYARHGVMPEERCLGNQYRINVSLRIDATHYDDKSDDLSSTISYADVYELLVEIMSRPKSLLESVAVGFVKEAKRRWPSIKSGSIDIVKTTPPIAEFIGEAGINYSFSF